MQKHTHTKTHTVKAIPSGKNIVEGIIISDLKLYHTPS